MYHFDPYNVFLAIATNIPQRLKNWFCGPRSHIWFIKLMCGYFFQFSLLCPTVRSEDRPTSLINTHSFSTLSFGTSLTGDSKSRTALQKPRGQHISIFTLAANQCIQWNLLSHPKQQTDTYLFTFITLISFDSLWSRWPNLSNIPLYTQSRGEKR